MSLPVIYVADANWILWRAFYTTKTSRPLADVLPLRVADMICKDALLVRADYLMAAFDGPKNFRKDLYPKYKWSRDNKVGNGEEWAQQDDGPSAKEKVYACLDPLFDRFEKWGIPFHRPRKREADDVLCSIAVEYGGEYRIRCGTQDKDAYQYLLGPNIQLVDSSSKLKNGPPAKIITAQKAEAKKGVKIKQMVDYQTLIGDSGDDIPSIKDMGPARAKAILAKYGSIKKWIESGAEKEYCTRHLDAMRLNRKLVKLTTDCAPEGPVSDWKLRQIKSRDCSVLGRDFHELHNFQWPKTKGLFG